MTTYFPFDPVGDLASNRIRNELHTVNAINGVNHNYLVPRNAPFYDTSVVVVNMTTGQALQEGVDYLFVYSFQEATEKVGVPISGGIAFVDPNRTGSFLLNYQTLGGEYVNDSTRAIDNGIETLVNLAHRKWEEITSVPVSFPPTPHTHRLDHIVGVPEIIAKFTDLEAAIKSNERHITLNDIVDINEGYIDPLTNRLAEISAAILTLAGVYHHYYVERNTGTQVTDFANVDDTWIDVGVECIPAFNGTYQITFGGNPTFSTVDAHYQFRFTVDGVPISQSTINGCTVGLSIGNSIKLQLRQINGSSNSVRVAGEGISCGLTLLRVSE